MSTNNIFSLLGTGCSFQGCLEFNGTARVDSNFQGDIKSDGTLLAGQESRIVGQIQVSKIVLGGNLVGDVYASTKVVLRSTAILTGNIYSPVLEMEQGAVFNGTIQMGRVPTVMSGVTKPSGEREAVLDTSLSKTA